MHELIEEKEQAAASGSTLAEAQNKFNVTVLKRARDLAQTFLTELQNGKMSHAFSTDPHV
eukprot:9233686-Prorocentrum_lima.AAC.1